MRQQAVREQPDATKAAVAARMTEMRQRTLALTMGISDEDFAKAHDVAVGPPNWDVGHIAEFEGSWLLHGLSGAAAWRDHFDPTYDADKAPRPRREKLALPERAKLLEHAAQTRAEVLHALERIDLQVDDPHTRAGFLHEMVIQHEAQHQENMLVAMQAIPGRYTPTLREEKPTAKEQVTGFARVPAGPFILGADHAVGIYDNEGPARSVDMPAFEIARAPVTTGEYLSFITDGGYDKPQVWSEDGWYMRTVHQWRAPKYWLKDETGRWWTREYDRKMLVPLDQPVSHVSWYEAEAYANWKDARLPTEEEWEKAATWDPRGGTKRRNPWGDEPWSPERANLDQRVYGAAPVGAYPQGASAYGVHQMMGDTWEWTASHFRAYSGFRPFPYEGYSATFFDVGFRTLRGGSWATRPHVARGTFRNWHHPYHQHVFAGFRLARDA